MSFEKNLNLDHNLNVSKLSLFQCTFKLNVVSYFKLFLALVLHNKKYCA